MVIEQPTVVSGIPTEAVDEPLGDVPTEGFAVGGRTRPPPDPDAPGWFPPEREDNVGRWDRRTGGTQGDS